MRPDGRLVVCCSHREPSYSLYGSSYDTNLRLSFLSKLSKLHQKFGGESCERASERVWGICHRGLCGGRDGSVWAGHWRYREFIQLGLARTRSCAMEHPEQLGAVRVLVFTATLLDQHFSVGSRSPE